MAVVDIEGPTGSELGSSLLTLLGSDDIVPGAQASYELCKLLYLWHPLGKKMTELPITKAQSLPRLVEVQDAPPEVKAAFETEWKTIEADTKIRNVGTQSRVYGIASIALIERGTAPDTPLDIKGIDKADLSFNVLDPLNTSGSLVLNQNPNSPDFQKHSDIAVQGVRYHRSRTVTLMHEQPIYIAWTTSAFGFVGRSVYQRALFPLKSFIQTMRADDMVARKVGLIVAVLKMASSVVDRIMQTGAAFKRRLLKEGQTDNVISIGEGEEIQSINLTNLEGPLREARMHILENIAAAADMPAKLLNNETFAEGFGEGGEDAKAVAEFVDTVRAWLQPLYSFMDMIVQRRAWNKEFYATMQRKYPEQFKDIPFEESFYRWVNDFTAEWPSLLREPESKLVEVDEVKFKTLIASIQVLLPILDPENKARMIQTFVDNFNANKRLFAAPMEFDCEAFESYVPPEQQPGAEGQEGGMKEPQPAPPFSARDAAYHNAEQIGDRIRHIEQFLGGRNGKAIARIGANGIR